MLAVGGGDRNFWVRGARPISGGLGGLEFDFAVGEELADAGAFGWGEVIVPQIQLGQVVQLPDFGRQARQFIAP